MAINNSLISDLTTRFVSRIEGVNSLFSVVFDTIDNFAIKYDCINETPRAGALLSWQSWNFQRFRFANRIQSPVLSSSMLIDFFEFFLLGNNDTGNEEDTFFMLQQFDAIHNEVEKVRIAIKDSRPFDFDGNPETKIVRIELPQHKHEFNDMIRRLSKYTTRDDVEDVLNLFDEYLTRDKYSFRRSWQPSPLKVQNKPFCGQFEDPKL